MTSLDDLVRLSSIGFAVSFDKSATPAAPETDVIGCACRELVTKRKPRLPSTLASKLLNEKGESKWEWRGICIYIYIKKKIEYRELKSRVRIHNGGTGIFKLFPI